MSSILAYTGVYNPHTDPNNNNYVPSNTDDPNNNNNTSPPADPSPPANNTNLGNNNNNTPPPTNSPSPTPQNEEASENKEEKKEGGVRWEHIGIALTIIFAVASVALIGAAIVFTAQVLLVGGIVAALAALAVITTTFASDGRRHFLIIHNPSTPWYLRITNPFYYRPARFFSRHRMTISGVAIRPHSHPVSVHQPGRSFWSTIWRPNPHGGGGHPARTSSPSSPRQSTPSGPARHVPSGPARHAPSGPTRHAPSGARGMNGGFQERPGQGGRRR